MLQKKFSCFLLALCILTVAFAACGTSGKDNSGDNTAPGSQTSAPGTESSGATDKSETSEQLDPLAHIPTQSLDRTVTFLVENYNGGGYGSREILPYEDTEIATYVEERNNLVEAKLGIKIEEIRTDVMTNQLRLAAQAGVDFDIAMPYMTTAGPKFEEGLFLDLYEFSHIINFDAPYWDQNAENNLSIGGKLYMTTGDFSMLSMDVTHCVLFNKGIVKSNKLEDPYKLVEKNEWTMDKMLSMAKEITADTDGEPGLNYTDTIGLFINQNFANSLFIGAGESFAKKDADGIPALTLLSPTSVDVATKIFDIFSDNKVLVIEPLHDVTRAAGFTGGYQAARDALGSNRALFVTISLSDILNMSEYSDTCDFGVLVTPKYTVEQDRYYSYISIIYATGCVIPVSNEEPEIAALVLETMAAASTRTVKMNYYERVLKLQKMQDEESGRMLDFIFDNRVYDIGAIYNWNGLRDFPSKTLTAGVNTFVKEYEAQENVFLSAMQKTIDFFS